MKIYNTISRKLEEFIPIKPMQVGMYNCGPTVYDYAHIGNWRAFLFADTLKRSLLYLGYKVTQVMNITDVGHLTSDDDDGEDKLEKGARREKKTVWEVAQYYIDDFHKSREALNILPPEHEPRATEHIPQQIEMIKRLMDKGYAYVTKQAVYFDVSKFLNYTELSKQNLEDKEVGVREEVIIDSEKRNPYDFRLWQLDRPEHQMQWDSPWGRGFPGWHIECSAMSTFYLGQPFDIHTGGVDHIPVHHTNEIAQAEAANGVKFVNYWMHNEHLSVEGKKMSKSLGNFYTLQGVEDLLKEHMGFESKNFPIALRYLFLTSSYTNKTDFTKESLFASFNALFDIYKIFAIIYENVKEDEYACYALENAKEVINISRQDTPEYYQVKHYSYYKILLDSIKNDLDTPAVLASLNTLLSDKNLADIIKFILTIEFDKILGLKIVDNTLNYIFVFNEKQKELIEERKKAREEKNYKKSDEIRSELEIMGIEVLDTKEKSTYFKK